MSGDQEKKDEKGKDWNTAARDARYAQIRKEKKDDPNYAPPVNPESQAKADEDMLENPSSAEAEGIEEAGNRKPFGDAAKKGGEA